MAYQPEVISYDAGIYQLEVIDPVDGGVGAVSNKPLLSLANRTAYLYQHVTNLENGTTIPPGLATINSPNFTGTPTAPTPALGDNSTKIATTAFVQGSVNGRTSKSVAGSSNVTLTAVEAGAAVLAFSGALTANIAVIVPAASAQWIVENNTTGAFTLTVKTASGSGIAVAQGQNAELFCDGTNVQPNTTDFPNIALTGTPTAPTASANSNTTQIATTAYVLGQASSTTPVMNGTAAVGTGTTWARADHVHPSDTSRAPLASPALTGTPTAPTAAVSTSTTQLATTAYVIGQAATAAPVMDGTAAVGTSTLFARQDHVHPIDTSRAPLASPAFTGSPTAPTQAAFDNDTSIATTAFVQNALGNRCAVTTVSAATTLTAAAAAGSLVVFTGSVAVTLPAASNFLIGSQIAFMSRSNGASIVLGGSDTLFMGASSLTGSIVLNAGDTLVITNNGSSSWRAEGGSITLPTAAVMSGANWTTPAVNDNSTKLATTAFVLGQASSTAPVMNGTASVGTGTTWARADHVHPTDTSLAPLASPALTGTPTAPTAATATSTTQIATTAFVKAQAYATLASPALTGTPTAPTAATATNTTQVATTAFVKAQAYATLASPALTGTPTAPTAAQFDSSTSIATTAFVKATGFQFPSTAGQAFSSSTTLTTSQLNGWGQLQAASLTITLPTLASTQLGATYTILGGTYGGTLKASGTDTIAPSTGGGATNTLTILPGESVTVVCDGSGNAWFVVQDGIGLGGFGSSVSGNGYQKLPSGLIIQWRVDTYSVTGGTQFTANPIFPIAFPNGVLQYFPILGNVGGINTNTFVSQGAVTKTSGGVYINSANSQTVGVLSFAIGF